MKVRKAFCTRCERASGLCSAKPLLSPKNLTDICFNWSARVVNKISGGCIITWHCLTSHMIIKGKNCHDSQWPFGKTNLTATSLLTFDSIACNLAKYLIDTQLWWNSRGRMQLPNKNWSRFYMFTIKATGIDSSYRITRRCCVTGYEKTNSRTAVGSGMVS